MSKVFLKPGEVVLINGGYLSRKDTQAPVNNEAFVDAQQHAEFIITFAKMAKGKNFKDVKADNVEDLRNEVTALLNKDREVSFIEKPKMVTRKVTDDLAKEAMAFLDFQKDTTKADKINKFMQQFKILKEYQDFGLFFEEGIVKLNNLYTVEEVLEAVTETIDLV